MRTTQPDMAQRLASDAFAMALRRQLETETYDIVQIEGLELAYLIPDIRVVSQAAVVLDNHNAETQLQRRAYETAAGQLRRLPSAVYSRLQIGRLEAFERAALEAADGVVAVSDHDAEFLRALGGDSARPLAVIPNSIDISEYANIPTPTRPEQQFDLVFSGKMDYRPNVDATLWFADEVWPRLRQSYPTLTWGIVGQKPHRQLDRLRTIPGITLTGRVEQVQPYLAAARVVIMPLRIGSGTRLKLIEAMAGSKAIVSTTVGAEGFPVVDREHVLLADTPSQLVSATSRLLDNAELRAQLGRSAQQFAEAYDWRVVVPRFDDLYRLVLDGR